MPKGKENYFSVLGLFTIYTAWGLKVPSKKQTNKHGMLMIKWALPSLSREGSKGLVESLYSGWPWDERWIMLMKTTNYAMN